VILGEQLPRRSLIWLIVCQIAVMVPHLQRVPIWIVVIYLAAALWRLQMYRQRAEMPGKWWRLLLGIAGATLLFTSFGTFIGLEPMVALLLVAAALKLLEAIRERDGYLLVFLGFFICVTHFIFTQTLPATLYSVFCTGLLVTALITLNQSPGAGFSNHEPLLALKMMTLAIPMMIVLFFLFPRIGPIWSVPSTSGQGTTGMSDFLRPGAVTKLGRSADVAFRARFAGVIPEKAALYWRGLVFSKFEDGTWRTLQWPELPGSERQPEAPETFDDPLRYRVVLEPTQQRWLYGMAYAESSTAGVYEAADYRLGVLNPIEFQFGYDVTSWVTAVLQPSLSDWRRRLETDFPRGLNPLTEAWVRDLHSQYSNDRDFVSALLNYFGTQPFYYTLEPPEILSPDFVDKFMFDSRRGFCEHYAYSFVAMLRMVGIPARIIAGYQGGEVNPLNNTLIVRQFDAHAWAEVWFGDGGWTRIDPTAAVAPSRIELGMEAALDGQPGFLSDSVLSAYRFRGVKILNWMRLRYDALAFGWQSFVIGFDSARQIDLLKDWFGEIRVSWFVAILLGSWAGVLLPLMLWLNRGRRVQPLLPEEQRFIALCSRLEQRGLIRGFGEPPLQTLSRARRHLPEGDPLVLALEAAVADLYKGTSSATLGA
jgi:transglutaminase-like putative cysteine protease